MISGLGTDAVELVRVEAALERHGRKLAGRILSPLEMDRWEGFAADRRIEFLAGRFAAKEAIGKALGIGIGRLSMPAVSVVQGDRGLFVVWGNIHHGASYVDDNWLVSITHSRTTAFAVAVWESR